MSTYFLPLHPAQQDAYIDQLINPDKPYYNIGGYQKIFGKLDSPLFVSIVHSLPHVFDVLRQRIDFSGHTPRCYFDDDFLHLEIPVLDYSSGTKTPDEIAAWLVERMRTPFSLEENGPLLEQYLIKLSDHEHWYFFKYHHMITDGTGLSAINQYIASQYKSLVAGEDRQINFPSYKEELIRAAAYNSSPAYMQEGEYWKKRLGARPESLLQARQFDAAISRVGETLILNISGAERALLESLHGHLKVNLQQLTIAAFMIYFSRITDRTGFIFGIQLHRRRNKQLRGIAGMFTGVIPFKGICHSDTRLEDLLLTISQQQREDYRHQHYMLADAARDAGVNVREDYLAEIQVNYAQLDFELDLGEGMSVNANNIPNGYLHFPLALYWFDYGQHQPLELRIDYQTAYFDKEDTTLLAHRILHILKQFKDGFHKQVADFSIIPPEEQQLLDSFNNTDMPFPEGKTFNDLFTEQVSIRPEAVALSFQEQQLTYRELDEQSGRLAYVLRQSGVGPDSLVPICMERSMEMIVAVLGIWKAGGAYVPVDPGFPAERIRYILEDCSAQIVISSERAKGAIPADVEVKVITMNNDAEGEVLTGTISLPQHVAYVIYTSGSTGKPKGVLVEHAGLLNRLLAMVETFHMHADTALAFTAPYTFDISVWQMVNTLICGGRTVIYDEAILLQPDKLIATVDQQGITLLQLVPSYLSTILQGESLVELNALEYLLVTGEAVSQSLLAQWFAHPRFSRIPVVNAYGPTEASDDVSFYFMHDTPDAVNIPVGGPIRNLHLYILGERGQLCPLGVPGEICVSGIGVARGYLNRPELTKEKFVTDPFREGVRMYRTGDLGKWLADGNIEYLGRIDDQVKIRGYRIELGEIESVLEQHEHVAQCVVTARPDTQGVKRLVGYIVPIGPLDRSALQAYLQQHLPDYMVPGLWVELASLPLTANGKIDKKNLPAPDMGAAQAHTYTAPRTALESQLAEVWAELLGVPRVGIYDNFFELGGHSLLAIRLIAVIRKQLSTELTVGDLFAGPDIHTLAARIHSKKGNASLPAITAGLRPERVPLSFSQERLWFIDQLEGSLHYHIPALVKLTGPLHPEALEEALRTIVQRHEVLRTVMAAEDGHAYQEIRTAENWVLEPLANRDDIPAFMDKPFILAEDYMLRAGLLQEEENTWLLAIVLHHIASDGWSMGVIVKELPELYEAIASGRTSALAAPALQYADYALWQRAYLSGEVLSSQQQYWKEQLTGVSPLNLPADYTRPAIQSTAGSKILYRIPASIQTSLQSLSHEQGVTLYMTLLAAFQVLLYRYSGQEDICVGTPVAGRRLQELENMIGFFVNTLAVRQQVDGQSAFTALLQSLKQQLLAAYEHQDLPFEKLVEAVSPERDRSRHPLFQVMFILQNQGTADKVHLGEVLLQLETMTHSASKFDLTFSLTERADGLDVEIEYSTALFCEDTIRRMAQHYGMLLQSIVSAPETKTGLLRMITQDETVLILEGFNDTAAAYNQERTFVELFSEQALRTPEATAVVFEKETLSYRELDERSNQLAHYLREQGVQEEVLVPLCLERSFDMLISILAVLKAGGAYVPVDPQYPEDRIRYMLEDTSARLVITQQRHAAALTNIFSGTVFSLDDHRTAINAASRQALPSVPRPDHLAYVIYTSGSTGKPKGVMIEHRSLLNFLLAMQDVIRPEEAFSLLAVTTYCFDISYLEMFFPLQSGNTVIICPREKSADAFLLKEVLASYRPAYMQATPATWQMLVDAGWNNDEQLTILTGGEAIMPELKDKLVSLSHQQVINLYGPTEATIWASSKALKKEEPVTIGKALANTCYRILDAAGNVAPVGVAGELHISGVQVARGYLNRPELTKEKFVTDPFLEGIRMYKTGDLAKWLPDGNIEYLGRMDDQVKIRGYRIELGEIESVLQQFEQVAQCVVTAPPDTQGIRRLVGYIVPTGPLDRSALQAYLQHRLPDYMVPGLWVELASLPLTANGKTDRKSLPAPDMSTAQKQVYTAPRTVLESQLAEIWAELLGVPRVGVYDNFFELGGHSLLAIRLIAMIRKRLATELTVSDLFAGSDIHALALRINEHAGNVSLPAITAGLRPERVPLSFSQERLWFIDQLEGSLHYHIPALLKLTGPLHHEALELALRAVVQRHEVLRTVIGEENGQAYQEIRTAESWVLERITDRDAISAFLDKPFILADDYMLRAGLLQEEEDTCLLAIVLHHIASDGWSMGVIVKELPELYDAIVNGRTAALAAPELQYADYTLWQRAYLSGGVLSAQQQYWRDQLTGVAPLNLPTDYPRPAVQSTAGSKVLYHIPSSIQTSLQSLSHEQGVTMYMTLLAAFQVLLYRYSGQEDICVGTPVAGRRLEELENMIGFFVNTLAVRQQVDEQNAFTALLQSLKQQLLSAYEYQDLPFEKMVEAVSPERDRSRHPLFQVMFALQNQGTTDTMQLGAVLLELETMPHSASKFDLTFSLTEKTDGLDVEIEYSTALFREDTIRRMAQHYEVLLQSIISAPQTKTGLLRMTTEEEVTSITKDFNDTAVAYNLDQTFADLFNEQVLRTPEAPAVVFENEILSYYELNERSHQLACYLRQQGVREEVLVPLCLERSFDMIIGILGILKAGGAYVPIDPHYPESRIRYMLEDTNAPLVLTQQRHAAALKDIFSGSVLSLDELQEEINAAPRHALASPQPGHLAYVIYTSGSTGKPKGVMNEHRGLLNRLLWTQGYFGLDHTDAVLQKTTFCFDVSVWELLWPLMTGAKLVFAIPGGEKDAGYISDVIAAQQITTIHFVPSMLQVFLEQITAGQGARLRRVLCSGEALQAAHVNRFHEKLDGIGLYNLYGPTEAAIDVSCWPANRQDEAVTVVPIGKPVSNTQLYILDAAGNIVPVGVTGELYIGGIQVARGYLNRAELTTDKFVPAPWNAAERLYRTGDVARWLPDGNIEYQGRIDDQVKIRGYRIELGEISHALQQHEQVSQCVVTARPDHQGHKRLVAYVVPSGVFEKEQVMAWLKALLPEYMVPALWVEIENIPLSANGKADIRRLPEPDNTLPASHEYTAPATSAEHLLANIWQDLLGIQRVGIHDNFFRLGGDSIIAIQVINRAKREGVHLQLKDIFSSQTIAQLAAVADNRKDNGYASALSEQGILKGAAALLPVQSWFFEGVSREEAVHHFNQSVLLEVDKSISEDQLSGLLQYLLSRHDALRFSYAHENGRWSQEYTELYSPLVTEDLSAIPVAALSEAITASCRLYQQSLDILQGDLLRMVWMKMPASVSRHRLLLTIHHLAVDGVSWRILLDDAEEWLRGGAIPDAEKGASCRQWAAALQEYGASQKMASQLPYWEQAVKSYHRLRTDKIYAGVVTMKDTAEISVSLDTQATAQLLKDTAAAFNTDTNDLLLAALADVMNRRNGHHQIVIGLEGHGREIPGKKQLDISRTVGWFTSIYPVVLHTTGTGNNSDLIKSIKEQIRQIPDKGLGYGVHRYINQASSLHGVHWDIMFNYLGQFDNVTGGQQWLRAATEQAGEDVSPAHPVNELITVNGMVRNGQLELHWRYSTLHFEEDTMQALSAQYIARLQELIAHCIQQARQGQVFTPSDFGLDGTVSYQMMDKLLNGNEEQLEDIISF
ncbi:MAG TPA: amino acid adenylation domain-containing protein [Chitinophaga sp.]|uniref:non-ribosomal peptide synthetase n=1 Tax=Chitinophaga sp. TaxID=1869181 RepID=UPI002C4A1A27|nr:non-ribosomal peptide synthetase [Chitinophaga sp.]HVI46053.1 amino acid adenylation domain-containing protein [Chitinophaga sp.]